MLSYLGNGLLVTAIALTIAIIHKAFKINYNNNNVISKSIIHLSLIQCTLFIICFFTLILAFIFSDFSLITVFQNSHTLKPLLYKVSGTWGNHEGSLLLWLNVLVIFSYLFLILNYKTDKKYVLFTIIFQNFIILFFSLFLFFGSNPFSLIFPKPLEGLGLNPILQDPALAIHPPLLYIGFVGSSIYFSAALGSLISNYDGSLFAKSIKPWVTASWSFLTIGIIVGSIWAYYELGWGGFWFWDPVENSSLMPWFAITALVHSCLVLEKKNSLYAWVIILCLMTFILSVSGTFLVRSGILNSVHSFASDPSRGLYILIFLTLLIVFSSYLFLIKLKNINYNYKLKSTETFVLANNWFMLFFLATVLIGTIYPIFTEIIYSTQISVGPPFYNSVIIPLIIPFLILMSFGPRSIFHKIKLIKIYKIILTLFLSLGINVAITYFFKSYSILTNLIIISALFLIFYTISDFVNSIKRKIKFDYPRIISHLGFGLLIFFIGVNFNFSIEKNFNLKIGQSKVVDNYKIDFENLRVKESQNYKAIIGDFKVTKLDRNLVKFLNPEIRIYSNPETITHEASIKSNVFEDYYLTMSNINRSEFYNLKFQNKPFMSLIWFSALLISLGGFLRLFLKR